MAPPPFLGELALLLAACAGVAYGCHRLGVMPIVSFLVTGALIGPHALGLVHDEHLIEAAAELGVILLLFTIGIEFSLDKLARIKRLILLGGGLQVGLVVAAVTALLAAFDVDWRAGVFTGCLVALSSTAIVVKLVMSSGDMATAEGQASLAILIFQDLAVVAMVLLVPMLAGSGGSALDIAIALAKAGGIVGVVLLAARRLMPPLLEAVARTCSQEIFLLSVVSICIGTAYLTSLAGVSLSLGAFLAGLVVSESRFSHLAFGEILPLQILFSATFFVSVGLLFDVGFLLDHPWLMLGVVVAVLAIKALTTVASLIAIGYGATSAACVGLGLAQVGEFSFVLERTGRSLGIFPAGAEQGGPEAFIGATVVLMIATPFLYGIAGRLRERAARSEAKPADASPTDATAHGDRELSDHVIIAGLGDAGRQIARVLHDEGVPYVCLTLSPEGASEAERGALRVLRGNYTRRHELELAGIQTARSLMVADDDHETTHRVVALARSLRPDLEIVARTHAIAEASELRGAGATDVVAQDAESIAQLAARMLGAVAADRVEQHVRRIRAGRAGHADLVQLTDQSRARACAHVADTVAVTPSASGCASCTARGDAWVHLRVCMTCGHVGCCDSSPNKHATKHHQETGHPIVKSFEPGEDWAWCYVDERTF